MQPAPADVPPDMPETDAAAAELLADLTEAQREAVQHIDGPLMILAGPGSGKTRVVTHRIAWLLRHGVRPGQVLALTFTNKAADEMQARLARLAPGQGVWMGTFHRFCARLLRQYAPLVGLEANFSIYDESDSTALITRAINEQPSSTGHFSVADIRESIHWAKNNAIGPEEFEPRPGYPLGAVAAAVYRSYQSRLLASNAVDFDDLLLHVAVILRNNPEIRATLDARYRYILVDEYQDTNLAQYAIVRAMSIDYPNLSVTGDPDQSIYAWRGANLRNLLEFDRGFPGARVVKLEQNYRSTQRIVQVATKLIEHNEGRKHKDLFTDNPQGPAVRLVAYSTDREESDDIARQIGRMVDSGQWRGGDMAIFYRVNALAQPLETALRARGVPYQIVHGTAFYERAEVKDLLAYLRLINNPRDNAAFLRVVNTPPRGIGKKTIERLVAHAASEGLSYLEAGRQCGLIESLPKRAAVAVAGFVAMCDALSLAAARPVESILKQVLALSGYSSGFDEASEVDQKRLVHIDELLTTAREFDAQSGSGGCLEEFLERLSLVSDTDDFESENNRVTLMTLHGSKGLEFPVVFLVGVEEGLIPHERSKQDAQQVEEERRLLFVGITRAKQRLQLSVARKRLLGGRLRMSVPSRFLMELPRREMETYLPAWTDRVLSEGGYSQGDDGGFGTGPREGGVDGADGGGFDDDLVDGGGAEGPDAYPLEPAPRSAEAVEAGRGNSPARVMPKLTTAAELAGISAVAGSVENCVFRQGMAVLHPEYGVGRIVLLAEGARMMATVEFAAPTGRKSFVVKNSPLRPLVSGQG